MSNVAQLASAFPPPDRADWLALVEKTLKGAGADTLITRTADGIEVQPLGEGGVAAPLPSWRASAGDRPWDVRTETRATDPAAANREILDDLAAGADSVLIRLVGGGVAIGSADDMARALDGVLTDVAPVALRAGFLGPQAAGWLGAAAKAAPGAPLAFHMDPIGAFARTGVSPGPIESHVAAAATVGARLADTYPKSTAMLASGRVAHEAGATEAEELAFALAGALAYAKALVQAGQTIQDAFSRIVLGLATDTDYFVSIAKLRAARRLWARLTAASGAQTPARIEARGSARMLARTDAWTNLVRLTAAGFAAAVGGADAVILPPFTEPLGPPTDFARRQARNIQLVLMEEAHLGAVSDPAGGSAYVEQLTDGLARAAWGLFQQIEGAGGVIHLLTTGAAARRVAAARAALTAEITGGKRKLVGITEFRPTGDTPPETAPVPAESAGAPDPRLPGADSRCDPLSPWRYEEAVA